MGTVCAEGKKTFSPCLQLVKKTYWLRQKSGGGIFQQARDRSFQRAPVRRRAEVG
jgi:hypothetical protein